MKASTAEARRFLKRIIEMMKRERLYLWLLIVSACLILLTTALPAWRILPLAESEPFIPLHYNVLFGIDRFGPWYQVFVLPMTGLIILLINIICQTWLWQREKWLSTVLSIGTVILQSVLLAAMVFIVLLNI